MIKLYGLANGYGSRAQVTRGFKQAIERLGLLEEFMALDQDDGEFDRRGDAAPISIMTGPLEASLQISPAHKRRFAMVAPNATKIPNQLMAYLGEYYTDIIVPSEWCLQAVKGIGLPVHVVPHGVFSSDVELAKRDRSYLQRLFWRKEFNLVHFSTSHGSRKGTVELAEGFQIFRSKYPDWRMHLTMVLDRNAEMRFHALYEGSLDDISIISRLDDTYRGSGMRPSTFADGLRRYHAVIQPSRAEAFGLIPLEALAAGVPVIATNCSGHSAYMQCVVPSGVTVIPCGCNAPIDDCDGAEAPVVMPKDICRAIEDVTVFGYWLMDEWNAAECRQNVLKVWDWNAQVEPFLRKVVANV
jgi:hypothetical protein